MIGDGEEASILPTVRRLRTTKDTKHTKRTRIFVCFVSFVVSQNVKHLSWSGTFGEDSTRLPSSSFLFVAFRRGVDIHLDRKLSGVVAEFGARVVDP